MLACTYVAFYFICVISKANDEKTAIQKKKKKKKKKHTHTVLFEHADIANA